ncbi:MAG: membrane protein insertase YidC, partial [Planctomycetota bacterium]
MTTLALWALWFGFIQPVFFPPKPPAPPKPVVLKDEGEAPRGFLADADALEAERSAETVPPSENKNDADPDDADAGGNDPAVAAAEEPDWTPNPARTVELGGLTSKAAKQGYYSQVTLTSRGAAVEAMTLNDRRYRELEDREAPLKVLGNGEASVDTFLTRVDALDAALRRYDTNSIKTDWALKKTIPDPDDPEIVAGAVFTLTAPDGSFEAIKTYRLRKGMPDLSADDHQQGGDRDTDPRGYMLDVDLTLRNLSDRARTARFTLQGPVGLPLENLENARKFRDLELGYYEEKGDFDTTYLSAADATEAVKESKERLAADEDIRRLEDELTDLQKDFEAAESKAETAQALIAGAEATEEQQAIADDAAAAMKKSQEEIASVERELAAREQQMSEKGALEEYRKPLRYVGTEAQYFAALLFPRTGARQPAEALADALNDDGLLPGLGDLYDTPIVGSAVPQVVDEPVADQPQFNDVSVRLEGTPVPLPAAENGQPGEATRSFTLFAGPKRLELLEPLRADEVMDLGWFGFIGRIMLWVMTRLHDFGFPYWLAIISLTVCVRMIMFPLSKRTALMAAKQKALAPKIAEIKKRCGDDAQAAGREQWALMNKYGVNPLMGCLPVFFTIPVFIALYNALLNSVDLRLAEFLWIDNLAAPDNVFRMPFRIPYIGVYLNILPLALAGLWFF